MAAVAPFNFTAIGGNLAGTPALMVSENEQNQNQRQTQVVVLTLLSSPLPQGNVVLWKPSDTAVSASYAVYRALRDAGLPPHVVQFLPAHGPVFGDAVTSSPHLAAINFTGSVP